MQKNIDSNLSVTVVESKREENDDNNASKVVDSRVESNGCRPDGSFRDNSYSLSSLHFENVPINNTQVISDSVIWASRKLEISQDPLLLDYIASSEDMGERFGRVGETTKWAEKQGYCCPQHRQEEMFITMINMA